MVTCQSANQLKTPAKVPWAFKMVSQFGSLVYTIMGNTADLTVVQKTIIETLQKEGKPQTFIAKEAGCSQSAVSKHVNRKLSGRKFTRPEPQRESIGYCQEENEKQETKKCRWAEGHCQRNLGFHTTSAVPQTDHLYTTPNWGSN